MEFSILNESSLHNALKIFYAAQTNGKIEVKLDGHIYDILTSENEVIEIQTQNLGKIASKLQDAIQKGKTVRLVYPLIERKTIILIDKNGKIISKRKSPVKGNIYDLFRELTGIYSLLLKPEFTLEVLKTNIIEERIQTEKEVQSKNKQRRFKKNWNKTNKRLEDILETKTFKNKDDYLALLPENLPQEFCAKDLAVILKKQKNIPARIYKNTNLILWVLVRMNVITQTKIFKRSRYYKIS